jgi:hypothetical protein
MPASKKHHHRTYSWPPSLHLIDISALRLPLPDIDDDPFAHFISVPVDDDDPAADMLSFSAGIVAPPSSSASAKAYKFRTSIARKWSRYIAKHYAILHHRHHSIAVIPKEQQVPIITLNEESSFKHEPTLGFGHDLLPESHAFRQQKRPSRAHHHSRHSWHPPPADLFTIKEEEGEVQAIEDQNEHKAYKEQDT